MILNGGLLDVGGNGPPGNPGGPDATPAGVICVGSGGTLTACSGTLQNVVEIVGNSNENPVMEVGDDNWQDYDLMNVANGCVPIPLVKTGTGTLVLAGTNTYQGGTIINAGTLSFATTAAVPTWGFITVNSGGTLNVPGGIFSFNGTSPFQPWEGQIVPLSGALIIAGGAVTSSAPVTQWQLGDFYQTAGTFNLASTQSMFATDGDIFNNYDPDGYGFRMSAGTFNMAAGATLTVDGSGVSAMAIGDGRIGAAARPSSTWPAGPSTRAWAGWSVTADWDSTAPVPTATRSASWWAVTAARAPSTSPEASLTSTAGPCSASAPTAAP